MRLSHIFIIATVSLFVLISLPLAWIISSEWAVFHATDDGLDAIQVAHLAMVTVEKIALERGPTNSLLGSPPDDGRRKRLQHARQASDHALLALRRELSSSASDDHRRAMGSVRQGEAILADARVRVDRVAGLPMRASTQIMDAVRRMYDAIPPVLQAVTALSFRAESIYPQLANPLAGARQATELREYAGRLGSQLTAALTENRPLTEEEIQAVDILRGRIEQLHSTLRLRINVPEASAATLQAAQAMEDHYFRAGLPMVEAILLASRQGRVYQVGPAGFAAGYVPTMATIVSLRDTMIAEAVASAQARHRRALVHLALAAALGLLALISQAGLFAYMRWQVAKPLLQASTLLTAIANGKLDADIPAGRRKDEIGEVLAAIEALRRNSVEKSRLEKEKQRLIEELTEVSSVDFLTGIANRRAFTQAAQAEIARAGRNAAPAALILFDIDYFKQVNDSHGHDAGDAVLKHVAAIAEQTCREGDLLGRYGGEEFVVLTSHSGGAGGVSLAERLRANLQASPLALPHGQALTVTASFGVAALNEERHSLETLLAAADHALYAAKRRGRNQVVVAEP
ncbi:diguanylate cyclase [Chromobacterium subtsugae]|uniref:diguanylate cyclase n=1 Tax=Chromobacterium subtsugae TaxID=251747 RepID=A0ABS7FCT3_9NEIS|nr:MULTISPECIES: diguanylate cyclase [Chromobacterium]KUM02360.1 hypothetical protein Cv017_03550 [Chromobacterium subtsugae]KZE87214.1 hypothetical protein AWB61_12800 [Chromobacterium sp. F49]MBW7565832.1 diguanylate cyclase [Chromobacterium subtsugae]MBW8287128.1 diguanylate cyclase [Chromobacterium subtsugae]OBU88120.1 hypothetical protein MY55_00820 [Chromobacterium subtsugae]